MSENPTSEGIDTLLHERPRRLIEPTPDLITKFWSKVDRSGGPDACWPWLGAKNSHGYGTLSSGGRRAHSLYAHRVSWAIADGHDAGAMVVCHRCDNPPCVNPAHLFAGTLADNMADMIAKGRAVTIGKPNQRRGERVPSAKLTAEGVRALRHRSAAGEPIRALAEELSVHEETARKAVRGLTWKHVATHTAATKPEEA